MDAVLQASNHVVGFLGDGTNDALALRKADVSVSVDSGMRTPQSAVTSTAEKRPAWLRSGAVTQKPVVPQVRLAARKTKRGPCGLARMRRAGERARRAWKKLLAKASRSTSWLGRRRAFECATSRTVSTVSVPVLSVHSTSLHSTRHKTSLCKQQDRCAVSKQTNTDVQI